MMEASGVTVTRQRGEAVSLGEKRIAAVAKRPKKTTRFAIDAALVPSTPLSVKEGLGQLRATSIQKTRHSGFDCCPRAARRRQTPILYQCCSRAPRKTFIDSIDPKRTFWLPLGQRARLTFAGNGTIQRAMTSASDELKALVSALPA